MDIEIVDIDPVTEVVQKAFRGVLEVFSRDDLLVETRVAYGYLMGKGRGWRVRREDVRRVVGCGGRKIRDVMRELRENGWTAVQTVRRKTGRTTGRRLIFCPRGDGKLREGWVVDEELLAEKPLAVVIGQGLPDPEYDRCHHGKLRRSCEECRRNFQGGLVNEEPFREAKAMEGQR